MSLPDSSSERPQGVLVRRPRTSIYTVLLMIALVAMMFGCLLLVIEMAQYGFQWKPPANLSSTVPATALDVLIV